MFREHQAGINNNNVIFPAQREAVHSELAKTAKGDNLQFFALHLSGLMLTPVQVPGCEVPGSEVVQKHAGIHPVASPLAGMPFVFA